MLSGNIKLTSNLSLRPMHSSDKVFIESLYHAARDDLRLIDTEEDFIETLIERQYHAQTTGVSQCHVFHYRTA